MPRQWLQNGHNHCAAMGLREVIVRLSLDVTPIQWVSVGIMTMLIKNTALRKVATLLLAISLLFSFSNLSSFALGTNHHSRMMVDMVKQTVGASLHGDHKMAESPAIKSVKLSGCGQSSTSDKTNQFGQSCCKMACAGLVVLVADSEPLPDQYQSSIPVFSAMLPLSSSDVTGLRRPPRA